MKKHFKKIISVCLLTVFSMCMLTACNLFGGGDDEEMDPTLYHLTLTYSSNVASLEEFKQEDLVAVFGDGVSGTEVAEGTRDSEEVKALKKAGATQEDIDKAGVRQSDGSYYFFYNDSAFINKPDVLGYKFLGFYYKGTNNLALNPTIQTDYQGNKFLPKFEMPKKDAEVEARYEKWTYSISFDPMENEVKDTNPNTSRTSYCYLDDGKVLLDPATTTDTHKTFAYWAYQDYSQSEYTLVPLEKEGEKFVLPNDFYDEYMRIIAVWNKPTYTITVDCKLDNSGVLTDIDSSDACESIILCANTTKIDGNYPDLNAYGTVVNESNELVAEYATRSYDGEPFTWFRFMITENNNYRVKEFIIDGNVWSTSDQFGLVYVLTWTDGHQDFPANEKVKYFNDITITDNCDVVIVFEAV